MELSFVIIVSLFSIKFIAIWGVAPCNLVDYMTFVGGFVTWAACSYEMYFDLCACPLYKVSHFNSPEVTYKRRTVKNLSMKAMFLKTLKFRNWSCKPCLFNEFILNMNFFLYVF